MRLRSTFPTLSAAVLVAVVLVGCADDDPESVGDPTGSESTSATPDPTSAPPAPTTTPPTPTAPTSAATTAPPTSAAPSTPTAPATPAGDPALREAAQAYSDAFLVGDAPAAFELLSERCKDAVDMGAFGNDAIAAGERHGAPQPISTYTAKVSGDAATLTYSFAGDAPRRRNEPWVREQGFWHLDDC